MLKKVLIGLSLLAVSAVSSAAYVVTQEIITGADMTGMEVTVTFGDGSTESGSWSMISNTLLNTGDPILDKNGFSGGVVASTWSLTQAGFTLGGSDDSGNFYGLWTLTNISSSLNITGFAIAGKPGNVAFDINPDAIVTPDSATGQLFVSDDQDIGTTASYFNLVNQQYSDLLWDLVVDLDGELTVGEEMRYFADTDLVSEVSAPAGIALSLVGLALFMRRQSRSSRK